MDPSTGSVGNALVDNAWYDASGRKIKEAPAGSKRFTKTVYDGVGRVTKQYQGFDVDESGYSAATTLHGDTILEQIEQTYDAAGNVTLVTTRQRYHNATGTGDLTSPSGSQPKARVTYQAAWHDGVGRPIATADYGTNGGSALNRPDTVPTRSDTVLVTSTEYNDAGAVESTTNPAGIVTRMEYDAAGRQVEQIMNYVAGSSSSSSSSGDDCPASDDTNVAIQTAYNADGNVSSITAVNATTGNQTTQYVYGTTLDDSQIAASTLKRAEVYPDSADQNDRITFKYNRQREQAEVRDQQGTVHAFDYDGLGRQTQDRVTTLGTGVDSSVRRIATSFEVRGMRSKITCYDNPTVDSGSVVNETEFSYNDFGQLVTDYQEHGGAVNTSTSAKVQYGYANGGDNTIRPTSMTYPDGRVLTYHYGSSGGIDDATSRVAALIDDDPGSTHLADYSYSGRNGFVEMGYAEPDLKYTLIGIAGGDDPDTGDIYRGLDRFGRVKDSYWRDYGSSSDADRIKYGYDRTGSRTYREQTVDANSNYDELYSYDLIDRLKSLDRGTLGAQKDQITGLNFAQCWGLDATGNWQSFRQDDDGAGWDLVQSRTANQVNEITDIMESSGPAWITPLYNRAGNMTRVPKPSDPTNYYACTYDAWNRLVKLTEGANTVAEYEYDGAKRRTVKKTYSGGALDETRHFYYTEPSKWQVIEDRVNSSSDPDRQFVWGLRYVDDLILRDRDTSDPKNGTLDERLYALQDANWNLTAIAGTDGTIQERYAYSAYGTPVVLTPAFGSRASSSYAWETRFAGYRFDTEVELYRVRNRVLRPALGWLQRDPLGYVDSRGLYDYASSNPVVFVDPLGSSVWPPPPKCGSRLDWDQWAPGGMGLVVSSPGSATFPGTGTAPIGTQVGPVPSALLVVLLLSLTKENRPIDLPPDFWRKKVYCKCPVRGDPPEHCPKFFYAVGVSKGDCVRNARKAAGLAGCHNPQEGYEIGHCRWSSEPIR